MPSYQHRGNTSFLILPPYPPRKNPQIYSGLYCAECRVISQSQLYRHWRLNPSCPPFKKKNNSPLWKRGVRGDFGKICLVNYDDLVKSLLGRHPGESRGPEHLKKTVRLRRTAFAGMTDSMEFRLFMNSSIMDSLVSHHPPRI